MRPLAAAVVAVLGILVLPAPVLSQSPPGASAQRMSVPRVISVSGEFVPADGRPVHPVETVTLRIYSQQIGGTALWEETQAVAMDASGFYKVLLGATETQGVPVEVFASGGARWLSTTWNRASEVEGPRVALTSVPYALRAADAESLGGLPASAYQLAGGNGVPASPGGSGSPFADASRASAESLAPKAVMPGTANYLAKYVNGADVGNSSIYELNGLTGFNTNNPQDIIHSRFTSTDGQWVGLVVQNLGNTATSYSGMLFRDQNGAVAQFQGFNNLTHEYRINNISSGGSINFMLGGVSSLLVAPSGRIGIGTVMPTAKLHVDTPVALEVGVRGVNSFAGTDDGVGVAGTSLNAAGYGIGGDFQGGWRGVVGSANSAGYVGTGSGVRGIASGSAGTRVGVYGEATTSSGAATAYGVYGYAAGATTNWAGYFQGNTHVTGTLSKGGGAFMIDHPLDPKNKYLMHSFVESPDMMNVYNGNVVLDGRGEATVTLPEWFEALNGDFRYQLTSIGAPALVYVAEEIVGNQFRIAGGVPNGKVSWMVTGVRQDAWAKANRIPTEVVKGSQEKGRYLHPEAHGQPKAKGLPGMERERVR